MNHYSFQNGEQASNWLPNNPFADEALLEMLEPLAEDTSYSREFTGEYESPFLSEVDISGTARPVGNPEAPQIVGLLGALHDQEFNEVLFELAAEFEDVATSRYASETGGYSLRSVHELRNYAAPLIYELETMISNMAQAAEKNDLSSKTEAEFEQFFDKYLVDHEGFSPRFEMFFGKVFNTIKNVAKGAVDLAKKGVEFAGKIIPIGPLLKKLGALVRPLIQKVINFAINRLPAALRPVAKQLAGKLMNRESFETEASYELESYEMEEEGEQPTTYEVNEIQNEFNARAANLLFARDEHESDVTVSQYIQENEQVQQEDEVDALGAARERFVQELSQLQEGEDPTPAIQRFIPALLPILRIVIKIIGRDKVVKFLGGLVAQLIGKILGNTFKNYHSLLGSAIADVGLKILTLEAPERENLRYEAYASTVEEILTEIGSRPENYTADSEAVQSLVAEAFETAVANNFPGKMVKPELRQASVNGMWYGRPKVRRQYRKYSHIFPITIEPRTAQLVKTFKGQSLASFLSDKLGLPANQVIQAKVHLYAATQFTKLSVISRLEKLPGLNTSNWTGYCQFHPLTVEAATLLINEPGLGKNVDSRFTQSRSLITKDQRFFFLEIPGAKVKIPLGAGHVQKLGLPASVGSVIQSPKVQPPIPRSSDAQGVLNFLKSEIRFNFYFSNEEARVIGQKLAGGDYISAVGSVRQVVRDIMTNTLIKNVPHKVKIIHEAVPELYLENFEPAQEQLLGGAVRVIGGAVLKYGKEALIKILEKLIEKFAEIVQKAIVTYLTNRKQEFITASGQQDGVTVKVIFTNVPVMSKLRLIISAMKGQANLGDLSDFALPAFPTPGLSIVGGRRFD